MDALPLDRESLFTRTGIHAGTAENTEILIHGIIGHFGDLALPLFLSLIRLWSRNIECTARTDIHTGSTALLTLCRIHDDLSFEELGNDNGVGGTDLITPAACHALVFVDRDFSRQDRIFCQLTGNFKDRLLRTCGNADTAGITKGFFPT